MANQHTITPENIGSIKKKIHAAWIVISSLVIFIICTVAYSFIDSYSLSQSLKSDRYFECVNRAGNMNILVDKSEGWCIKDGYFIKGSSKIDTRLCKPKGDNR